MLKNKFKGGLTAIWGSALLLGSLGVAIFSAAAAPAADPPVISLKLIASGFSNPLGVVMTGMPNDERLFVIEKGGAVKIVAGDGQVLPSDFINISTLIGTVSEQGLLGLRFDPNFAQNGEFYLSYSRNSDGASMISRFTVSSPWSNQASLTTEMPIIRIPQDFANHNGGDIHFGPDGYLYITLGDGGSSNDPNNRGQTRSSLLGNILRIDVDTTAGLPPDCGLEGQYSIPANNPFVSDSGSCDEIWAYGVRNPWRMSFDRQTGDLYFGDVGQNAREELNFQAASSTGGEDYGWRCMEGNIPTPNVTVCNPGADYLPPIYDYVRTVGKSVTGGYVYRGENFPRMQGIYFSGDFSSGQMFQSINESGWKTVLAEDLEFNISSFGETRDGELLIVDYGGKIYQMVDEFGLDVEQTAPSLVVHGEPTTHSIKVTNVGTQTVFDIVMTDTLPSGVTHISGGALNGSTVTWNLGGLDPTEAFTVSLVVSSTQSYTNSQLLASADGIGPVMGNPVTVQSWVAILRKYLPLMQNE